MRTLKPNMHTQDMHARKKEENREYQISDCVYLTLGQLVSGQTNSILYLIAYQRLINTDHMLLDLVQK